MMGVSGASWGVRLLTQRDRGLGRLRASASFGRGSLGRRSLAALKRHSRALIRVIDRVRVSSISRRAFERAQSGFERSEPRSLFGLGVSSDVLLTHLKF